MLTHTPIALAAACAAVLLGARADAIMVLESTYQAGLAESDGDGFAAAKKLASQPQFAAILDLRSPKGEDVRASGIWIGNDEAHGYVLTAGHNFCDTGPDGQYIAPANPTGDLVYATTTDDFHAAESVSTEFDCASGGPNGSDFAIVKLRDRIDNLGEPPTLYGGGSELGRTLTFIGYGQRGTGKQGVLGPADYEPTAAESVVTGVWDADGEDGNFFITFFPSEEGMTPEDSDEVAMPVSEYQGGTASGDSGGPAFIQIDGKWYVAGVVHSSTGGGDKGGYGSTSNFARVAGRREWILSVFPGARFGNEGAGEEE